MNRKLSILHFNVIEKYPPSLNLISDLIIQNQTFNVSVITSVNNSPYNNQSFSGVKIIRLGSTSKISVLRYASYINYNFLGTLILLITRPDVVLVYESLSIFPAFIYSLFFPKKSVHIHFHEYMSTPEKLVASKYMKFLFKCQDKIILKCTCSQTNEDRKKLFLEDYSNSNLKSERVSVFPNLPPKFWWREYGQYKRFREGGKIKMVYVGALDAETMYLEEVLTWVCKKPNELVLTIFSQEISVSAKNLILQFQNENIVVKSALDYNELPIELIKHDIGLVLYKGHIPNYVFNIPNKVFEYLSCGLQVVFDSAMLSLSKSNLKGINEVEFTKIQDSKIIETFKNYYHIPVPYEFENDSLCNFLISIK